MRKDRRRGGGGLEKRKKRKGENMMCVSKLRKNQTVGDGVCFLEFNSGKILFWNVFLLVTFI